MDSEPATIPILPRLRDLARSAARHTLDVVLPPRCLACGRPVAGHGGMCARCWNGLDLIARPCGERLCTPVAVDLGAGLLSPKAVADPPGFGRLRAVACHDGAARELVHRLKYADRMDLSDAMGRWIARAGAELLTDADALVP